MALPRYIVSGLAGGYEVWDLDAAPAVAIARGTKEACRQMAQVMNDAEAERDKTKKAPAEAGAEEE